MVLPSGFSPLHSASFRSLLFPSPSLFSPPFSLRSLTSPRIHLYPSMPHLPSPPAPGPCPPQARPPGLGRGGHQASSAQGALGVLLASGFQVGAGGLATVSLEAERRAWGRARTAGWGLKLFTVGEEGEPTGRVTDPHGRLRMTPLSSPDSAQRNRLTARRPPDLSRMSRARELKA